MLKITVELYHVQAMFSSGYQCACFLLFVFVA